MPTYTWRCLCSHTTDVVRSMKDIDIGPDLGCDVCGNRADLLRVITVDPKSKNFILEGHGWHADQYLSNKSRN